MSATLSVSRSAGAAAGAAAGPDPVEAWLPAPPPPRAVPPPPLLALVLVLMLLLPGSTYTGLLGFVSRGRAGTSFGLDCRPRKAAG